MTVALQIRDVPEDVRETLAEEARRRGQSLQAYLLGVVEREARALRNRDLFGRTRHLRMDLDVDPVDLVREGRARGFDADRGQLP